MEKKIDFIYFINNSSSINEDSFSILINKIKNNVEEHTGFVSKIYFIFDCDVELELPANVFIFKSIKEIPQLSDNILLFDKIYFFNTKISYSYFFENDLPKDMVWFEPIKPKDVNDSFKQIDEVGILNFNFIKNKSCKKHYIRNFKYGFKVNCNNFLLNLFDNYVGFKYRPTPIPLTKECYKNALILLENYSKDLQLNSLDVCRFLRSAQLVQFKFIPFNYKKGLKKFSILEDKLYEE